MTFKMKKKIALKRLRNALRRAPNLSLFEAIWAIDRNQNKGNSGFQYFNKQPKEITTTDITSNVYLHKFHLENLMNFSLMVPFKEGTNKTRVFNFKEWNAIAELHNTYKDYIDALAGTFLDEHSIHLAMRRIMYQQNIWQDGSSGKSAYYRFANLILGENIREHFVSKIEIEPIDYLSHIFILWAHFQKNSILETPYNCSAVGISNEGFENTLTHLSTSIEWLERNTRSFRGRDPFNEYAPSVFSEFPIIKIDNNRYVCALPDLILFRLTNYFHLDMREAEGGVRNSFSENFEEFIIKISSELFRSFKVIGEFEYKTGKKGNNRKSPDVLFIEKNNILVVVECKTTGVGFEAKYNQSGSSELPKRSEDIIKGFTQIWRFNQDVTQGLVPEMKFSEKSFGILLTLEHWFVDYEELYSKAVQLAETKEIAKESRIPILIMPVSEFEIISKNLSEKDFLSLLEISNQSKYHGWFVSKVMKDEMKEAVREKEYNMDSKLSEISDLWKYIEEFSQKRSVN